MLLYGGQKIIKQKWKELIHNGIYFKKYIPHNIPILINKKEYILPPEVEEYATIYTKYLDTQYSQKPIFHKNFWKDFKPMLKNIITNDILLEDISFELIKIHLNKEKEKQKLLTKEEKEEIKNKQNENELLYKYCIVDGNKIKIANYHAEPPSLYVPRGEIHPLMGRIKKRIYPEDIILNLSKNAPIPKPNIGGKWKKIVHDNEGVWIASWKDKLVDKMKYVYMSMAESFFKSTSDITKFDKARKLKKKINNIRETYNKMIIDPDNKIKQLGVLIYLLDLLSIRVGSRDKNTKKENDSFGLATLRIEHITILDNNQIQFDFLGKDCVRYKNKFNVIPEVYENLKQFINNKNKKDKIFDLINAKIVNDFLATLMDGLTSKVWRTYNSSLLFQKQLDKVKPEQLELMDLNDRINFLVNTFQQANASVALYCNHTKRTTSSSDKNIINISNKIKELKSKKKKIKNSNTNNKKDNIKKIDLKIKSLQYKLETKTKLKNVALGTSKDNYIDPRIVFAFIKKFKIPQEKVFTKSSIARFSWASDIDETYRF
jgi:DNA topoisomerase-1